MNDDHLLAAARQLLSSRVGHEDAVSSATIARFLGLDDDAKHGTPATRELIARLVAEGMPIGATAQGYFVLATQDEFQQYIRDLEDRALAIEARAVNVTRAWDMAHRKFAPGSVPAASPEPKVTWTPADDAERV